jgi:uncharacterized protein YdiU (UPF0061 family)
LGKLAEAWHPLLPLTKAKQVLARKYDDEFNREYMRLFRGKLGLLTEAAEDDELIKDLFRVMGECHTDFTS